MIVDVATGLGFEELGNELTDMLGQKVSLRHLCAGSPHGREMLIDADGVLLPTRWTEVEVRSTEERQCQLNGFCGQGGASCLMPVLVLCAWGS